MKSVPESAIPRAGAIPAGHDRVEQTNSGHNELLHLTLRDPDHVASSLAKCVRARSEQEHMLLRVARMPPNVPAEAQLLGLEY